MTNDQENLNTILLVVAWVKLSKEVVDAQLVPVITLIC